MIDPDHTRNCTFDIMFERINKYGWDPERAATCAAIRIRVIETEREHINRYMWETRKTAYAKLANGKLYLWVSSMDCDGVSGAHVSETTLGEIEEYIADCYDNAEGPMSISLIHPDEVEEARASEYTRDLAMEAYEDGHPHVLSEVRYETH